VSQTLQCGGEPCGGVQRVDSARVTDDYLTTLSHQANRVQIWGQLKRRTRQQCTHRTLLGPSRLPTNLHDQIESPSSVAVVDAGTAHGNQGPYNDPRKQSSQLSEFPGSTGHAKRISTVRSTGSGTSCRTACPASWASSSEGCRQRFESADFHGNQRCAPAHFASLRSAGEAVCTERCADGRLIQDTAACAAVATRSPTVVPLRVRSSQCPSDRLAYHQLQPGSARR
jgi:hypothetical protein